LVELNSTLFPFLGPIGTFINAVKVFIGGVFGIYLIILYFRVREYLLVKKVLMGIQRDIRTLAEKQGVEMGPLRKIPTIREFVKHRIRRRTAAITKKKRPERAKRK
jgi:hypothetical protein